MNSSDVNKVPDPRHDTWGHGGSGGTGVQARGQPMLRACAAPCGVCVRSAAAHTSELQPQDLSLQNKKREPCGHLSVRPHPCPQATTLPADATLQEWQRGLSEEAGGTIQDGRQRWEGRQRRTRCWGPWWALSGPQGGSRRQQSQWREEPRGSGPSSPGRGSDVRPAQVCSRGSDTRKG